MFMVIAALILLLSLWCPPLWADVTCDGVDDALTGAALSNFITNSTSAATATFTATTTGVSGVTCWPGRGIIGDIGGYYGLLHTFDDAVEHYCAFNYDGASAHRFANTTLNTPHHLVLVHTGGNMRLYYDGVVSTDTTTGNTQDMTNALHLCQGAEAYGAGVLSHAGVFSTAPSAGEIAAIALSRTRRLWKTAATGMWDIDECTEGSNCNGVTVKDRSGNGRNMTGNYGANTTGLAGKASVVLRYPGGMQ
jgi:hypothetical protein